MYQHIYNNDGSELGEQMQAKIVDVYDGFISFCIKASEYYSKRSISTLHHLKIHLARGMADTDCID